MTACAGCSAEVPDGSTICPACGAPPASEAPTVCDLPTAALVECGSHEGRPRFAAGTVLASRYRIVTALGRGGMGEVYRADDLKLNQTVALKFLPRERAFDAGALARLQQEVRLARQISHPSVCRVFDLAEIDGQSFLCMEYIDGEDLASLLRRIGRLPVDKALEIARQVAAGLATIHDGGLLHRDLKPGNVMIDGRGRARITDFGLAVLAGEVSAGRQAGTPSYMAPEQHAGHEASPQTDLYAFGLVVYEMLAGHPAWSAKGGPERPVLPASVAEGVDTRIRTILLRCLESAPRQRPSSALQVLAALTGKDLLALAVDDGLVLSPETIAAAPKAGSLRPAVASSLFLAVLVCLGAVLALAGQVQSFLQTPSELPPDVLAERARSLLRELGVTVPPRDWASGFSFDRAYKKYLATTLSKDQERRLLSTGSPPLYAFWYRTSSDLLLAADSGVTPEDPSRSTPGQAYLELDLKGRLHHLEVTASGSATEEGNAAPPNWRLLLTAAGFSPEHLRAVSPRQIPPVFADSLAAWEGNYPQGSTLPALPVRIEAAAFRGIPVWLDVTGPWSQYREARPGHASTGETFLEAFRLVFYLTGLLAIFLLAWHNLRRGRGDRRGAFRLAVVMFVLVFLSWLIKGGGRHVLAHMQENFSRMLAESFEGSIEAWLSYLAFEPFVRRLWPERIISWNRLLAGKFRDPLVGRDVLVGCLLGLASALAACFGENQQNEWPRQEILSGGLQGPIQGLLDTLFNGLAMSLEFMVFLLVLRILLRRQGLAIGLLWALMALGFAIPGGPFTALRMAWIGLAAAFPVVSWTRFGPLAGSICWVTFGLALHYPLTLDRSAWYSGISLFAVLVILSFACYGFFTSVAGQPWFARSGVLDD